MEGWKDEVQHSNIPPFHFTAMKKRIESLDNFKEEKRRVRRRIRELEGLLEEDITQMKDHLKPWKLATNTVKELFVSKHDGVMGETIGLTVNGLIKKVLLRRSNWLLKFVVAY